tara:strand:- start:1638 stop:2039 length:402 start_codon:yes stop_codon:yes gene_type:complete
MIYMAKYNRGRKSKALQEATDLTQGGAFADIVAPPRKEGDPTGQTTMLENQAGAISPIQTDIPSAPTQQMPMSPINLSAPTNKPAEPITSGIPLGAGDNGPTPLSTDTVSNILKAAKSILPDPIWDELLEADF